MGTRSIIAEPVDNGFRGRYCHWDGNPGHMAKALHLIVRRDSIETARRNLLHEHKRWVGISPALSLEELTARAQGEQGVTPIFGYGTAFDEDDGDEPWFDQRSDVAGWVYVLNDTAVAVLLWDKRGWVHVGSLRYDEGVDPEYLRVVECGENYERCTHYVGVHVPDAPEPQRYGGMYTYMGHAERGWNEVIAVIMDGERIPLSRSGGQGSAHSHGWQQLPRSAPRYWWSVTQEGQDLRTARIVKGGGYRLDYDTVLMATHNQPELVVPKGTVLR